MLRKCLTALVVVGLMAGAAKADLVARWNFDDGTANNQGGSAGAAANGTLEGGASIVYDDSGFANYYGDTKNASLVAQIPGSPAHINCGGGGGGTWADLTGPITITAWMQPDIGSWTMQPGAGTNWAGILTKGTGETDGYSLSRAERFGNVAFVCNSVPGWNGVSGQDPDIWDGNWHHVAATYFPGQDGPGWWAAETQIYIDGVLSATGQKWGKQAITPNLWDVIIGASASDVGTYRHWTGLVDDVRIYDVLLGADAIENISMDWWRSYYVLADADGPYEIAPGGTVVLDGSDTIYGDGDIWMDWFIGGEHVGAGETLSLSYDTLINDFGLGLGVYDVLLQAELEDGGYVGEAWTTMEVVPEPATIALFGLGGLALLRRKR